MALDSDGNGYAVVKTVTGEGNKAYVKVKQVDDTSVKNYLNVKETDGEKKDYLEVVVVDYDSPKDYVRVNFIDAPDPVDQELILNPDFDDTSAWELQGASVTFDSVGGVGVVTSPSAEGIKQTILTESGVDYDLGYLMQSKTGTVFVRAYESDASSNFVSLITEYVVSDLSGGFTFTALSDYTIIYLRNTSSGTTEWDQVSVKEVV